MIPVQTGTWMRPNDTVQCNQLNTSPHFQSQQFPCGQLTYVDFSTALLQPSPIMRPLKLPFSTNFQKNWGKKKEKEIFRLLFIQNHSKSFKIRVVVFEKDTGSAAFIYCWGGGHIVFTCMPFQGERGGIFVPQPSLFIGLKKAIQSMSFCFPKLFFFFLLMNQHLFFGGGGKFHCNISNPFYYQLQNYGYCYKWFMLGIIRRVNPNRICLVLGKTFCIILNLPEYIQFLQVPSF